MTAVVALEHAALESIVTIPHEATIVEPTKAGFLKGDKYTLRDMLAALLIKSGNDAAVAISVNIAGSEEEFAKLMNKKALEIGMNDTRFVNASGLPDKDAEQHTTATDLSKLMLYALRYPEIIHLCSLEAMTIRGAFGKPIELKTHNRLLFKNKFVPWGKTGYTRAAKRTFVGVNPSHEQKRIVFAFLKSDDIWRDIIKLNAYGLGRMYARHDNYLFRIKKWVVENFFARPLYVKV